VRYTPSNSSERQRRAGADTPLLRDSVHDEDDEEQHLLVG
jgi:hypothetical protein